MSGRGRTSARMGACVAVVLLAGCGGSGDPASSSDLARGIDAVFADLDRPGSPGAAVSVIRDGEIVHSRGYGYAQIEHSVPVTPRTVFHVASVSKQFTAMAVTMLAAEGALSLDDRVQAHLGFVPEFEHPVTVRQMIHHTSGIRDQWQLLGISGWRLDDVITTEQILGLMSRQRELNFVPGSEYLYSNMGYTLLARTAAAVSGMSFPEFTAARIFRPLGMDRTHFHDDHEHIVPGRAYSYRPASGDGDGAEYTKAVLSYANAGATSLFTTADDLARWLDNFRHETVGGPEVMEMMTTRGVLNGGDTIPYAHGLSIGDHRGLRTVGHGGADAGFRTQATWYPEANVGVVVLTNVANGNPGGRVRQVAEVVLAEVFPEAEPEEEGDTPSPAADSVPPPTPDPATLAEYAGTYYSPELDALYHLEATDEGLVARHIRHGDIALEPRARDEFATDRWFMRQVRFERAPDGSVSAMRVGGGRVRNLLFIKLTRPLPR
ncbi:MAG: serine hydrolase [Gemmatimonadales bacterium]|nr:serine hydrolase [Candidatus Palauibacter denitrificans]